MSKICRNCGSAVPEEAKFCTECGGSEFELQQDAGGFSPSVSDGSAALDSSLPEGAKTGAQQAYGQQQTAGYPSGDALGMAPHPSSPSPQGEGFANAQPYAQQPYAQQNDNAAFGGYTSSGVNAGYAGSPQGEGFGAPAQPYGQQPYAQQPYAQQNDNAAFGGYTSSGAFAPPSPQGEGFPNAQQPYGAPAQPYGQQPYGAPAQPYAQQPYAQPAYGAAAPKKSKKGLIIAIIALVLVLGLAAVALFVWPGFLSGKSSPIDGEWLGEYGETMIIGDGRITLDHGEYGKSVYDMKLDGENLELTQLSEMTYKIEGDTLTLTVLNQGERVDIVADRVSGSGGIEGEWGNLRVVDEDGESQSIGGSTMEFRSDGTYVSKQSYSDDINGTYEVSGDRITVRNTNDKINFVYTLEGDTLTFWEKNEAGELEEVEKFTRKGANGGSEGSGSGGVDTALLGEWIEEEGDLFLVFNSDGTGNVSDDDDDSAFTYRLNGENITLVREGVTYNYTYEILNGALYFYDEDGEIDDVFYREGALPVSGYTGASVVGEWDFDVSGVDYGDMYDAMMGDAYDTSGVSETAKRIMQDAQYKEALREPITNTLSDYKFDFRSDGSVYIIVGTDDYVSFMAKSTEAMIPLLRTLTTEEAADYYGMTVAELEQYLASNGMTWDQQVDGIAATYSEVNSEFDEYSVAEVLGGTVNADGDVELYAGSFTQNGDQVTMTGSGGGVTVFVFDDDDTLLLDGISGSDSELAMFMAMDGLKFVR
ncbi:MAG: hypothetical protein IJU94_06345 [Clostridia bacterium]|nr:hypothetical protein [Clostridia bacterium]